jgi:hypothetical protein
MMHPMLTAWGGSVYTTAKKTGGRALALVVMVAAMALAVTVLFAAQAWAAPTGSFAHRPPNAVLMKGATVLHTSNVGAFCWYYGPDDELCGDPAFDWSFPRADGFLKAGTRLHIRLAKPERPEFVRITAYRGFDKKRKLPIGEGRELVHTFGRVERDGKTVGWDVFFRVNRPGRHYYLDTVAVWEEVPGTRISYGGASYSFHVRTR